ncbi:DUF1428 domain-containing protein [Acuticoccus sp. M5D2P5]|uniref:DUF1428 domain-containing protein n=1 Tax=Acuticoccus kalidii TaxID=2910977 RepID=UPI001F2ADEB5|nr:DUF1428 domain-containing protein [Acuticoccus kalidii]MCF3933036.1 DUF1428 domain-containing protein [Acuticoccus kalidii]
MTYVDGFLLAVPTANREAYIKLARQAGESFKKNGALSFVECWGDDVPDGKVTSFPMAVKKTEDETVVFSWITWPDKATRDAGMKATMEDMQSHDEPMPFDGMRMMFGGFETIVEL